MSRVIIAIVTIFHLFQAQPAVASGLCLFGLGDCLPEESEVTEIIQDQLGKNWFVLPNISFKSKYEIGWAHVENNNKSRTTRARVSARKFLDGRISEFNSGVFCDSIGEKFRNFHSANRARSMGLITPSRIVDFVKFCEHFQDLKAHGISRGVEVVEVERIKSNYKSYTFFLVAIINNPSDIFIFADDDDYTVPTANFGDLRINEIYEQTVFGTRLATAEFEVSIVENRVGKKIPRSEINYCGRNGRGFGFFAESCQNPTIAKGTLKFEKRSDGWKPAGFEIELIN